MFYEGGEVCLWVMRLHRCRPPCEDKILPTYHDEFDTNKEPAGVESRGFNVGGHLNYKSIFVVSLEVHEDVATETIAILSISRFQTRPRFLLPSSDRTQSPPRSRGIAPLHNPRPPVSPRPHHSTSHQR